MHISALYIYPLKGGAALELTEADVTPKGLKHDRVFMAVRPDTGAFITQRENLKLALIKAVPDDSGIVFSAPEMDELRLTWAELQGQEAREVTVWQSAVSACETSSPASAWLSSAIGQEVILVYQPPEMSRPTNPKYAPTGEVSFADGYPLLVAFTSSLDNLNERIVQSGGKPVSMQRFRPNIVISNETPWEEDTVGALEINSLKLSFVKPCTRCIVTTINQNTAVKEGPEPLRTLATFRFSRELKGVLFAENAVPAGTGKIKTGDAVKVVSQKKKPGIVLRKSG